MLDDMSYSIDDITIKHEKVSIVLKFCTGRHDVNFWSVKNLSDKYSNKTLGNMIQDYLNKSKIAELIFKKIYRDYIDLYEFPDMNIVRVDIKDVV